MYFSSPQSFWHQGLVLWKTGFPWTGGGEGWFGNDSNTSHLLCTLFLLLLHKLHFRSSGIRSRGLGTPDSTANANSISNNSEFLQTIYTYLSPEDISIYLIYINVHTIINIHIMYICMYYEELAVEYRG